jgi:hypothetical protein
MSNQPSGSENVPPGAEGPGFGPGPFSASDIRTVFTAIDIHTNLGRLEQAVKSLESVTKSHCERIYQVTRQADETKFAQAILERAVALQGDKLHRLENEDIHHLKNVIFVIEVIAIAVASSGILLEIWFHYLK